MTTFKEQIEKYTEDHYIQQIVGILYHIASHKLDFTLKNTILELGSKPDDFAVLKIKELFLNKVKINDVAIKDITDEKILNSEIYDLLDIISINGITFIEYKKQKEKRHKLAQKRLEKFQKKEQEIKDSLVDHLPEIQQLVSKLHKQFNNINSTIQQLTKLTKG